MGNGSLRGNRLALAVGALALLAGIPTILAVAKVRDPWILAGTTAAAAVIVVFSAVLQERYKRLVQRRDEQEFTIQDGCLVLADGRLPAVRDITDPVRVGVHQATAANTAPDGRITRQSAPVYVPRDIDGELREQLASGAFVLLIGDSTAGKSRAAFEAVSSTLTDHVLICPSARDAIAAAVDRAARERRCVLWLDDLEGYLGTGGLTAAQLGRLLTGEGHHRVIVATIRTAEQARITANRPDDDAGRQALHDIRQVLDQAYPIRVARMFTSDELDRAHKRDWDPRIAAAIDHADSYGIAEYLAAGPELLRDWQDARDSSGSPNARGAALVAAAIDIRRAGYTSPIPRALLNQVHEQYLTDPEHIHSPREPADHAWAWATRQRRATAALLRPAEPTMVEVFDYLVDTIQRRVGHLGRVPEKVVQAAIDSASPADAASLASTAQAQGRYVLAEQAWRKAYREQTNDPSLGPEHPDTLISRQSLASILLDRGQLDEAETETRAVLEASTQTLGADHSSTLASRHELARVLLARGQLDEAETETRAVLEARTRTLGADHPSTLASRVNLANVLHDMGQFDEAETETRAVLEVETRTLGADHPHTLLIRHNLARVLLDRGQLDEAETETRAVLEARTRILGADHPLTLTSRHNLALILHDQGQLDKAETENRAVLEASIRTLGAEHPSTLISRSNLAEVLLELGRLDEAETENRAVLEARTRTLGAGHFHTLTSREYLARILLARGHLNGAETETRAVLEARIRTLGADHPSTLTSREYLAKVLLERGQLDEAETKHAHRETK